MAEQALSHPHCPAHVVGAPDLAEQISSAGLFFVLSTARGKQMWLEMV